MKLYIFKALLIGCVLSLCALASCGIASISGIPLTLGQAFGGILIVDMCYTAVRVSERIDRYEE